MLDHPTHILNWYGGWSLVLAAFITGAVLGMHFAREDFLGGYAAFPRRLARLGHIALAALGMLNVVYSLSPWPVAGSFLGTAASICFLVGGVAMPAVCFLTAWRMGFKSLFFIPVTALMLGVVFTLLGGMS
jgi:hypothetical protein